LGVGFAVLAGVLAGFGWMLGRKMRVADAAARYSLRAGSVFQRAELLGAGENGPGEFGFNEVLSGDGRTALIGAPYENGGVGAVWVFRRSGSTWSQQGSEADRGWRGRSG
jgi:hypothetical protein